MTASRGDDCIRSGQLTGAILAGGASRRLGRDKVTLPLAGKPLALWVAEALAPVVADLWIVTNHPHQHLVLGLPLITDLLPSLGPVGGLATVLFWARTPWVLLTAADAPDLAPALLTALAAATGRTSRPALVCRTARGLEPFPGLYAARLFLPAWEFLQEQRSFRLFLERCRPEVWGPEIWGKFDPEGRSFLNLNRPEDLRALAAWKDRRPGAEGPEERPAEGC